MQVTESYLQNYLNTSVSNSSSALAATEAELSSGLAITKPSDNPAGTAQILTLNDSLANITQYQTDATSGSNALSETDSTLQSVQNLLTEARSIAVSSANTGTTTTNTQAANATQIASIISQITNLANTQVSGSYIFSGTQTATQPYTPGDTTFTYNGNNGALTTTIGPSQQVQVNTPGSTIFAPIFTALSGLQADITAGNGTAVSNTDLTNIDAANSNLDQVRANIGESIDQITNVTSSLTTATGDLQNQLSSVQDADIATVYTQLQTEQNVYQASLEATAETFKYTLADFIST